MKALFPSVLAFLISICCASAQSESSFPASWLGNWTGELEIYNSRGLAQKIFMGLNIQPTDSAGVFTYEITYGEGEAAQTRPYVLQTVDPAKGHYRVDEGNSILLDAYWRGSVLVEIFSVEGSLLITTIEQVEPDVLLWQIIVGKMEGTTLTGGGEFEGEKMPEVTNYMVPVMQRARLLRQQ